MKLVYLYAFMIYASWGNLHSSNYTNASTSINTGNTYMSFVVGSTKIVLRSLNREYIKKI